MKYEEGWRYYDHGELVEPQAATRSLDNQVAAAAGIAATGTQAEEQMSPAGSAPESIEEDQLQAERLRAVVDRSGIYGGVWMYGRGLKPKPDASSRDRGQDGWQRLYNNRAMFGDTKRAVQGEKTDRLLLQKLETTAGATEFLTVRRTNKTVGALAGRKAYAAAEPAVLATYETGTYVASDGRPGNTFRMTMIVPPEDAEALLDIARHAPRLLRGASEQFMREQMLEPDQTANWERARPPYDAWAARGANNLAIRFDVRQTTPAEIIPIST